MRKKLYLLPTLSVLVFSAFLFSEKALATSCAGGTGSCRTNACSVGESSTADTGNDCLLSNDEVCCLPAGRSAGATTDCTTTGCPTGKECTGIFIKTCTDKATTTTANKKGAGGSCALTSECQDGLVCTNDTCQSAPARTYIPPSTASAATTAAGGWSLGNISGFGLPQASITRITGNLLDWILGILAIVGVIGFVISGIIYLVSTGDETMIERAKEAMKWSIVGVIVGLSGVIIIQAVDWALNGFAWF